MYKVAREFSEGASLSTLPEAKVPHMLRSKFQGLATVKLYYFDYIARVQAKGKLFDRVAVLTQDQLVIASLDGRIRRCINAGDITRLVYEKSGNMVLLMVPNEYDLLLRVARTRDQFIQAVSTVSGASIERKDEELKPSANLSCPKGREKNRTFYMTGTPPSAASSSGLSSVESGDSLRRKERFGDCDSSTSSSSGALDARPQRTWAPGDEREVQVSQTNGWEEETAWVPCLVTAVDDENCTTDVRLHHYASLHLSLSTQERNGEPVSVPNSKVRTMQTKRDCPASCWCQQKSGTGTLGTCATAKVPFPPPSPSSSSPRASSTSRNVPQPSQKRGNDEAIGKTPVPEPAFLGQDKVYRQLEGTAEVAGALSPSIESGTPQTVMSDEAAQAVMPAKQPVFNTYSSNVRRRSAPHVSRVASPVHTARRSSARAAESHIALYDFNARSVDEVSIQRGDALLMVSPTAPDNGWCTITNLRTSRTGYLPVSYVTAAKFSPHIRL